MKLKIVRECSTTYQLVPHYNVKAIHFVQTKDVVSPIRRYLGIVNDGLKNVFLKTQVFLLHSDFCDFQVQLSCFVSGSK